MGPSPYPLPGRERALLDRNTTGTFGRDTTRTFGQKIAGHRARGKKGAAINAATDSLVEEGGEGGEGTTARLGWFSCKIRAGYR